MTTAHRIRRGRLEALQLRSAWVQDIIHTPVGRKIRRARFGGYWIDPVKKPSDSPGFERRDLIDTRHSLELLYHLGIKQDTSPIACVLAQDTIELAKRPTPAVEVVANLDSGNAVEAGLVL